MCIFYLRLETRQRFGIFKCIYLLNFKKQACSRKKKVFFLKTPAVWTRINRRWASLKYNVEEKENCSRRMSGNADLHITQLYTSKHSHEKHKRIPLTLVGFRFHWVSLAVYSKWRRNVEYNIFSRKNVERCLKFFGQQENKCVCSILEKQIENKKHFRFSFSRKLNDFISLRNYASFQNWLRVTKRFWIKWANKRVTNNMSKDGRRMFL